MPGGWSRPESMTVEPAKPAVPNAWIAGLDQKLPYDLGPLSKGEQISELWNEQGDTFVYLFPENTGRPASFKVDSSVFASSPTLTYLARGGGNRDNEMRGGGQQSTGAAATTTTTTTTNVDGSPRAGPPSDDDADSSASARMHMVDDDGDESQELHLYIPIPFHGDVSRPQFTAMYEDLEALLTVRNLFAFLVGQSLISSSRVPSLFSIFLDVSAQLTRFEFSNFDGSNFGETASTSFASYCDELRLDDVRKSREKTIDAIVLGERLRYYPLYLEGFVHAVGIFEELRQQRNPKYGLISEMTQKRLERGYIDLNKRLRVVHSKLDDFDFPSVFSGSASSTSSTESKIVHFKAWKSAFLEFRRFIVHYYSHKYGSWPPKANSKKNDFEESGLNRQLLKDVYTDFADLYDLLVDRTSLTTRMADSSSAEPPAPSTSTTADEISIRALRQLLGEYDRSTPPVQPPIPFDVPQLPKLSALNRKPMDAKKEAKQRTKKLKDSDINTILMSTYGREGLHPTTAFIEAFTQYERRQAHHKSLDELADLRCGQWIFLYCVIQSLPLLVVDAYGVKYTEGVEHFLCVAPHGTAPWIHTPDPKGTRSWFGVQGGAAGVVSMPSDIVLNGVEGVFRRSHCWQVAEQWADLEDLLPQMPPPIGGDELYENESSLSSVGPHQALQSSAASVYSESRQPPVALPTPRMGSPAFGSRAAADNNNDNNNNNNRYSIYSGLEALPLPAGVAPIDPPARPVNRNPTMSFDDILKDIPQKETPKKGKK